MNGRRLLVTGASGFIGRFVAEAAERAGFEVFAVGRRGRLSGLSSSIGWRECDLIADEDGWRALVADLRPTHLFHGAWCTEHGAYWRSDENLLWLSLTARLTHAFVRSGGLRFVMAGSCAEYTWSRSVLDEEESPTRPGTLYGACKLAATEALGALSGSREGFTAVTGRIFFAYGPHENSARIVPYICRSLSRGEPAELSSGTQVRDFLHVEDVARGFVTLLESDVSGPVNIGSGEAVRLADIAATVGRASGRSDLIRFGARADRPDDSHVLVADVRRLRALGWTPRRSLDQGLSETYTWWATQPAGEFSANPTPLT